MNECDAALQQGVFDKLETDESSYSQLVWAFKLSTMSASEAREALNGRASFPIDGIPVDGSFSDEEFSKWKQSVQQTIDYQAIESHKRSISQLSASPVILENWNRCIAQREGIVSTLRPMGENILILTVNFKPYPTVYVAKIDTPPVITGGKFVDHLEMEGFESGKEISGAGRPAQILRDSISKPVIITMSTDQGGIEEYAPAIVPVPPMPTAKTIRVEAARWVEFKQKLAEGGQKGYKAVTFDYDEGGTNTYRSTLTHHEGKTFIYDFWDPRPNGVVGNWRSDWKVMGWVSAAGTKHAIAVIEQT